ncbi:MAG: class I SAM-dependent methyltransferase [Thermomicrobiales bacterium]
MAIEHDPVAAQYESWVYPQPILDMAEAVAKHTYFDACDPALVRRKLWPKKVEPDGLDILIAGCGANQAAYFAFTNPESRVVGIDISEASLAHEKYLKQKHDLRNLELYRLNLEQTASLERTFDLIVTTGVLHHLTDPGAGLRRLRDGLKPHGVMILMLYGYYPRVGVHMLQEAFRVLGLRQDAAGIEMVKHTLNDVLPRWHHLNSYNDPDRGFDAGLVDTYLHPRERAYTVAEVLQLVSESQLKFQGWLDNLDYSVSLHIPKPQDPLRKLIETLPVSDQWRVVELIGQALARHFVLACHVDRPETDYTLDFTGQAWLDYVPSLRPPIAILSGQPFESNERPPNTATSVKRYGHRVELNALESALLLRVDGKRPIIEIIEDDTLNEENALQRVRLAREFFRRMAGWDHLQYEIP